ncbi:hypothetical protein [Spirosoma validum]|uniref:DUF4234 domain-containing protein n=1 Tax=Spirosoma validum TaxID=2771355 RepID=A0A927GCF5_9BACT|nr:hypothetical protein [Spirosoma validum]MBD2752411.1 hypothetical protein [Spirosoma validum]
MENNHTNTIDYVRKQPVWAFCLLSFFTGGLYTIYWFFRGWRFLRDLYDLDVYPFWRAVFSIFFVHTFMDYINDIAVEKGHPGSQTNGYASGFVVVAIVQRFSARVVPMQYAALPLLLMPFLFLIPTVKQLNYIYEQDHPNAYLPSFSAAEAFILLLGAAVVVLGAIGTLMGEIH